MHIELATETLKTGETLRIERVTSPDSERVEQIDPFLAHKPANYRYHIEADLAGAGDGLETYYYIGLLDGTMVGNIMTAESRGVGLFGHVHTRSDQRRKGICSAIMRHQMADFGTRGGQVLLLGTGYQSAAYWIYHAFGFRDWEVGHPGLMRFDRDPEFATRFFAPAPAHPMAADWRHWPLVALLASLPGPVYLRSLTFGIWGTQLLEGPYLNFLYNHRNDPEAGVWVLESETGAVTACATWLPDTRWNRQVVLLDLFAHPDTTQTDLAALLRALPLPARPIQCYADPKDPAKIAALEAEGFQRTAVLSSQFQANGQWCDAWLYSRSEIPEG